jgi:sugar lactone lactonase YvrE
MQTWKAELLYKADLILGEGTHWHAQWRKFLYIDIEGKKLGRIDPVTKVAEERNVGKRIGAVVPFADDKLIIALQGSIEEFDFETGGRKELIKIESDKPDNRCNEGKCDAAGRLWIGTMHVNAKAQEGTLYCYNGSLQKKIEKRSVSNGICWSKDNRTMYYVDSFDYNIKAYDFDLASGNISNERVAVNMQPGELPDGMCIDEEDKLWVAVWGSGCVHRYDAGNGRLISKVLIDAPHVTACAFGGNDGKQLFITTAKAGLNQQQLQQYPLSGSLFCANVGIKGLLMNLFNFQQ